MTAAENGRTPTFTVVAITGLLLLSIAGCKDDHGFMHHKPPKSPPTQLLNGADTFIVISGGSVHFRAKKSGWKPCDGTPASSTTTCYKATFSQAYKTNLQHYQFFNDDDLTPSDVSAGWEIEVIDKNPNNQDMVLVCSEVSSDYTACDTTGATQTGFIYVIAKGGTFEPPPTSDPGKLLYDDPTATYSDIGTIVLNVSATGSTTQTCTKPHCALFFSE